MNFSPDFPESQLFFYLEQKKNVRTFAIHVIFSLIYFRQNVARIELKLIDIEKEHEVMKKGLDKQCRFRSDCCLIRVFPVCYSDKHFVNFSPEINFFLLRTERKSVRNFRSFTVHVWFR